MDDARVVGVLTPQELQRENQAAFNALMSGFPKPTQDWVLVYVSSMGIPMTSPQWLPAAMTARLTLEIHQATQDARCTFDGLANELGEAQSRIEQNLAILETLTLNAGKQYAESLQWAIGAVKTSIEESVKTAACQAASPLEALGKRIETSVTDAIRAIAQSAAVESAKEATKKLSLDVERARKTVYIVTLIALGVGALCGWLGTNLYDLMHRSVIVQSLSRK